MKPFYFPRFLFVALLFLGFAFTAEAQKPKSPPASATHTIGDLTINVNYNAPSVKGRTIWGGLEPYGKVWRTGANQATTIEINQDVLINGEKLAAGKYALFTIPNKTEWTVIFNKEANQWGAYNYDAAKDALRITAKPGNAPVHTEQLTFTVEDNDENIGIVSLMWDKLKVSFNVAAAE